MASLVLLRLAYAAGESLAAYGDLYPRWYGLRALLLEGRNPYGTSVSAEATRDLPLLGSSSEESAAGQPPIGAVQVAYGFLYPLPGALVLAPLALLPYRLAWTLWVAGGVLVLPAAALGAYAWWRNGRAGAWGRDALLAVPLAYLFLPSLWNLALAQPGLAVLGFTAGALRLSARWPAMAGAALAVALLLKPQLVLPLAPFWLVYRAVRWARARAAADARFVMGAVVTAGALTATATALVSSWPTDFLEAARGYGRVPGMDPLSPAVLVLSAAALPGPAVMAAAGGVGLTLLAWSVDGWRTGEKEGIFRALLVGALIVPPAWETSGIMLLVPLAATLAELRGRGTLMLVAAVALTSAALAPLPLVWPWRTGAAMVASYVCVLLAARTLTGLPSQSGAWAGAAAPPVPPRPAPR